MLVFKRICLCQELHITNRQFLVCFLVCFVVGPLAERDKMKRDTFQVMTQRTGLYSYSLRQPPMTVHIQHNLIGWLLWVSRSEGAGFDQSTKMTHFMQTGNIVVCSLHEVKKTIKCSITEHHFVIQAVLETTNISLLYVIKWWTQERNLLHFKVFVWGSYLQVNLIYLWRYSKTEQYILLSFHSSGQ